MSRVHNFSPGPCTLPLEVLEEAQDEFLDFHGTGMSLIEMSHRSPEYEEVHEDAIRSFRQVLSVPDAWSILFLQGGATLQFAMIPMNLLKPGERAAHVRTGSWAQAAERDGAAHGVVYPAWDGRSVEHSRMPRDDELRLLPNTRYLHVTTNETIEGLRMVRLPDVGCPVVADMSSDYASRPIEWERCDLVYGGAQKNLGPAGLTVVALRQEILAGANRGLASYLRYEEHARRTSLLNTPPMFSIYLMGKMLRWILDVGGVKAMEDRARRRSTRVYEVIDSNRGFYRAPVEPAYRSLTNIVFRLPSEELEERFLKDAAAEDLVNLKGHRSVGGVRVSVYNGTTDEAVNAVVQHMHEFVGKHG